MPNAHELARLVGGLIEHAHRAEAIRKISEKLGVETFLIFLVDPEAGVLLAAPGFLQTLPNGRRWRDFLERCKRDGEAQSPMPWLTTENLVVTRAHRAGDGSVIAFIGGSPQPDYIEEILSLLPLLTAALKSERLSSTHSAQATFSADLVKQSQTLAFRLDEARRATQRQLQERQRSDLALQKAREELQLHAADLEKRVAERTEKLSETVGELEAFSYSLAHDLRAPLRAMQGYAQFVLEECENKVNEEAMRALKKISSSAIRLDRLIQDVLDYSRIVRAEFHLASVDLDVLTREIIELNPEWHFPKAEVEIAGRLPMVFGNEALLSQGITNLLGNAIKFVPPGTRPCVKVFAEIADRVVRLCFRDNGIGIDDNNLQRIFRIFERLHHDKEYQGTGIGLAIVQKAVERMGGKVGVQSQPGQGSVFWLELKGDLHDSTHSVG